MREKRIKLPARTFRNPQAVLPPPASAAHRLPRLELRRSHHAPSSRAAPPACCAAAAAAVVVAAVAAVAAAAFAAAAAAAQSALAPHVSNHPATHAAPLPLAQHVKRAARANQTLMSHLQSTAPHAHADESAALQLALQLCQCLVLRLSARHVAASR